MDHRGLVTTKVRTRSQYPTTSLREVTTLEDLYQIPPMRFDLSEVLARNPVFAHDIYFPFQRTQQNKNEFLFR